MNAREKELQLARREAAVTAFEVMCRVCDETGWAPGDVFGWRGKAEELYPLTETRPRVLEHTLDGRRYRVTIDGGHVLFTRQGIGQVTEELQLVNAMTPHQLRELANLKENPTEEVSL